MRPAALVALLGAAAALLVGAAAGIAGGHDDAAKVLGFSALAAVAYLVAIAVLHRHRSPLPRAAIGVIIAGAVLARAALVIAPPVLEDDVYRYLWDGAVLASGESPYRFSPQEVMDRRLDRPLPPGSGADDDARLEALAALSSRAALDDAFGRINYPSVPTIYPPAAQALFAATAAVAPGSVRAMKLVVTALDLVTALLLAVTLGALGRSRRWVLLYAWSPLILVSFAGAAHMDILPMVALAAAILLALRHRPLAAGAALGVAAAAKLFPLLAWPALRRHLGAGGTAAMVAALALAYAPFLSEPRLFEGLRTYAEVWRFNAAGFAWIDGAARSVGVPGAARPVALAVVVAVTLWSARRAPTGTAAIRAALIALGALVLLSPAVNPWYVAWLIPLAAIAASPLFLALGLTALAYYAHFLPGGAPPWLALAQFGAPLAVALVFWFAIPWRPARWRASPCMAPSRVVGGSPSTSAATATARRPSPPA